MTTVDLKRNKDLADTLTAERSLGRTIAGYLQQYGIGVIAVILAAIVAIGNPAFLSLTNIANMLSQWAPAGLMAIGMTYVIIAGGFDLSIAAVFSFSAVVAAAVGQEQSFAIALGAAVVAGAFVGVINAGLIARFNVMHSREIAGAGEPVDMAYLCGLGPAALPALDLLVANINASGRPNTLYFCRRSAELRLATRMEDWRAWTFRGYRLKRYLAQREASATAERLAKM